MHHPTDRIAHTTAFVTLVMEHWLEREIKMSERSTMELHLAPIHVWEEVLWKIPSHSL